MLVCLLSISCQYTFTTYSLAGGDNLLRHITLKLSHYLTHVPRDYRDLLAVLRSGAWCDNSAGGARWWWWCSCGVSSACCARLWPRDRVSRRHVATLADSAGRGAAADTARWQRTRDTGGGRVLKWIVPLECGVTLVKQWLQTNYYRPDCWYWCWPGWPSIHTTINYLCVLSKVQHLQQSTRLTLNFECKKN